jgi:hypothetical protein
MKIFLDTNVIKASLDNVLRMFPTKRTLCLGKTSITFDQYKLKAINPNDTIDNEKLKSEVQILSRIAAYWKTGTLEFITGMEVIFELWGLRKSREIPLKFHGVPISIVDAPIMYQRAVLEPNKTSPTQIQVDFLKSLKDERFLQLQKACGAYQGEKRRVPNQLKDAFFIWCAESAHADYFLTLDFNLINHISKHKVNFRTF